MIEFRNEQWADGALQGYTITVDNGDGTGTLTTYDAAGNVLATEPLTGMPIPVPAPPDPLEVLASIGEALGTITVNSTSTALRTALLNVRAAIDGALP